MTTSHPPTPAPANVLLTLIIALLAPMFLAVCNGDIDFARAAALETVNDYRARNNAGLLAVALIVAYGLAALGSLSRSMEDAVSTSMALRLRGNANALNRSAEQNRQALNRSHAEADMALYPAMAETGTAALDDANLTEDTLIAGVVAAQKRIAEARRQTEPTPTRPTVPTQQARPAETQQTIATLADTEQQSRTMWASAMAEVAGEFTASLAAMRPEQRRAASIQAAALTSSANALLSGAPLTALTPSIPR